VLGVNQFTLIESKNAGEQVQVRGEPRVKSFASSASTSRAVSHWIGPIEPGVSTFPTVLTPTCPRRPAGGSGRPIGCTPCAIWGRIVVLMTSSDAEHELLRETFDRASDLYQRVRPDYPADLSDRLLEVTQLRPEARLLEIGCATGKATLPLARLGFRITCIELGAALAAVARRNLAGFSGVEIIDGRFETWDAGSERFDLIFAATAWHWIDPLVRYRKAAAVLTSGGNLAFWDAVHVFPHGGDPFFEEIQEIYDEIGESLPPGASLPRPGKLDDRRAEIEDSGLFEVVDVSQFDWETVYDTEGYVDLLNTFSGHIAMQDWQRDRLYSEIRRRLAERPDGQVRRHWGGVLHIARRLR
jgi:SAM-dependent methyltransferase